MAGAIDSSALERRAVNVVRALAMDAVQAANSGHPGTPMALAPLAHVLWTRVLRYDASAPDWPDRDRFVLSAGHASMLLYSMLHLTGYDLGLDDLREFRQWGSRAAGHPEQGHPAGVEVTTGPLGQGIANAVGFALAEQHLRARFGAESCDHRVFAVCGDGDLMEGISHEAASLAGHLGLGRLVTVFDDNHITIDGPVELACRDDVPARFRSYGWHVVELGEAAEDLDAIEAGLREAMTVEDRPSLVVLRSHIGYPSPTFTDSEKAHGAPFGAEEIARTKELMGLPVEATFAVPDDVASFYREAGRRGKEARREWEARSHSDDFTACITARTASGWEAKLPRFELGTSFAPRFSIQDVLDTVADLTPGLITGSGDLTGNTGMAVPALEPRRPDAPGGRIIHYGVREHAMAAIANGLAADGLLPCVGTFFVFSDYMRPAVRLAAMTGAKVCFVWTHDSVGVGEDGPTHQPIEHLAALRAMPGLRVVRPADANEVAAAWRVHIDGSGPTALVLSRQALPVLDGTAEAAAEGVARGAYVLVDAPNREPDLVLVGTGSEVSVCVAAVERLAGTNLAVRVVSMPSWDCFERQDGAYRASVLPPGIPTLAVEAGVRLGWDRYADDVVSIDRFGASAPGPVVMRELGIDEAGVVARAHELLGLGELPE
ncbi:MAG: transketolase [Actinomycetota bacterium]